MFNVITPCSRPQNLASMKESLRYYGAILDWYIAFDMSVVTKESLKPYLSVLEGEYWIATTGEVGGVTGSKQRNKVLDNLYSKHNLVLKPDKEWVYFLDDDNLLHPELIPTLSQEIENNPRILGYIFNQQLENSVRIGSPKNTRVTHIDTAQYCLRLDLIDTLRFKDDYCADGYFIEELYNRYPDRFKFINKTLCYYNRLQWKDYGI